jgi:SAM-dependent methyltransferase
MTWTWDETLFAGTASYYGTGRLAYPPELARALAEELGLDGEGRLLDVGCGPGSLTTLLAPHFAAAVGVDADRDMIAEARRAAPAIEWHCLRAEELPAGLGTFRCVTFAQSFHWMDQPAVARAVRGMLEPGGRWVHVSAQTNRGETGDVPWDGIQDLVETYLGPVRRAGRSTLPQGTKAGEEDVMRTAGFRGPVRVTVPWGVTVTRSADEIVASVFSTSYAAPHLFGARLPSFEQDLRSLLGGGAFAERMAQIEAIIWSP